MTSPSIRSALCLSFAFSVLGACSSGSSAPAAGMQPEPVSAFAGDWTLLNRLVTSSDAGANIGFEEYREISIAVTGDQAEITTALPVDAIVAPIGRMGALAGTIVGDRLRMQDAAGSRMELTLTPAGELTGEASLVFMEDPSGLGPLVQTTSGIVMTGVAGHVAPPPPAPWFGSFDLELTLTASSLGATPIGTVERDVVSIDWPSLSTPATMTTTNYGELTGLPYGSTLTVRSADGLTEMMLEMDTGVLTGTATMTGSTEIGGVIETYTDEYSVSGGRYMPGRITPIAINTGTWSFELRPDAGQAQLLLGGLMLQTSARASFRWAGGGAIVVIDGSLIGDRWTATASGALDLDIEGTFAQDGDSFTGTFSSTSAGQGVVHGSRG